MPYHSAHRLGPSNTPKVLKFILLITIIISILSAIITPFLTKNYIPYFLGISPSGIKHLYLWQFISYAFLQPSYSLNFSFIIHLLFNTYLIWVIGTDIVNKTSSIQFLFLYFVSIIISGLTSYVVMLIGYPYYILATTSTALFTCLIAWMMLNPPEMRIFLFFSIPIKVKWAVLGLLGFNLIVDLSNFDIPRFFSYLIASFISYLFCVIIWQRHGPFSYLLKIENELIYFFKPIVQKIFKKH